MESAFQFRSPILLKMTYNLNDKFNPKPDEKITVRIKTEVEIKQSERENSAYVILRVNIGDESIDSPFTICAEEGAEFKWDQENLGDARVDRLLKQNAPALLLSYLRPLISTVTAASPYGAYNIPFVDFTDVE